MEATDEDIWQFKYFGFMLDETEKSVGSVTRLLVECGSLLL